jgi:hypothetical protein
MEYNNPVKSLASAALVRQKGATTEKIAQWDLCSIGISRQMADSIRTFPSPHGCRDAQRSFEVVLNNMNLFRLEGQNAF